MDTLIRFLKTSRVFALLILLSCGQSDDGKTYLNELKKNFPQFEFSLTDPVLGLDLTVDIKSPKVDSTYILKLFKETRAPLDRYPNIKWVYLNIKNGNDQLAIVRKMPNGEVVFIDNKRRDR